MNATVTRMDYRHPKGGLVASIVLEGIDAPPDSPQWVLVFPERGLIMDALFRRGERWATKAQTDQEARACLNRVGDAIVAWSDRRMESNQRLVESIDKATSRLGVTQEALPLDDGLPVSQVDMTDGDRCPAHGERHCDRCSRTNPDGSPGGAPWLTEDGTVCRGCGYFAATGMHWDTCPARVR